MPSNEKAGNVNDLQFDRADSHGEGETRADAIVCAACSTAVRTWYYDVEGAPHCAGCKQKVERSSGAVRDWGLTFRAAAFGLGAAIVGAIIYYAVIAITNFEIGIVALLIGWMVGRAMRQGASGRGGRRLQVSAAALTYFAVALAYAPLVMKESFLKAKAAHEAAAVQPADTAAPNSDELDAVPVAGADATEEITPTRAEKMNPFLAVGFLVAFTLGLPVIVILGTMPSGLISALIIGIGMQQAWKMTGANAVTISGPFKVGRSRSGNAQAA